MRQEIKVLVVDDSGFMRHLIKNILDKTTDIKVIDFASNGSAALKKIKALKPDVVTLDIDMPILDGSDTLARMNKECPIPAIILSNLSPKSADTTVNALLESGATDFVQKPIGSFIKGKDIDRLQKELIDKIRLIVNIKPQKKQKKKKVIKVINSPQKLNTTKAEIIVIGASTGGPNALERVMGGFPSNFPRPILIIQHMPSKFTTSLAQRLDLNSEIKIKEASDGDIIKSGYGYLAPGNYHMTLDRSNTIHLNQDAPVCNVRPSVDVTLLSVNKIYKGKILGVILTGMGHDGTEGIKNIKEAKGMCIAQDEKSSTVYGMSRSIIEENLADIVAPLSDITKEIINLMSKWQ